MTPSHDSDSICAAIDVLLARLLIDGAGSVSAHDVEQLAEHAGLAGMTVLASQGRVIAGTLAEYSPESLALALSRLKPGPQQGGVEDAAAAKVAPPTGPSLARVSEDLELLTDFVVEAREHLTAIEGQLLALEQDPRNFEEMHAIFRAFHTIKGMAGFLELETVQRVAHHVETLLDLVRNDRLAISPEIVDLVLHSADFLRTEVDAADARAAGRPCVTQPYPDELVARVERAVSACEASEAQGAEPGQGQRQGLEKTTVATDELVGDSPELPVRPSAGTKATSPVAEVNLFADPPGAAPAPVSAVDQSSGIHASGTPASAAAESAVTPAAAIPAAAAGPENGRTAGAAPASRAVAEVLSPAAPGFMRPAVLAERRPAAGNLQVAPPGVPATQPKAAAKQDSETVRVETSKLDHLLEMIGEMVIAQSLVQHHPALAALKEPLLAGNLLLLSRITKEVQNATMGVRMIPIGQLFHRSARVVRDLSRRAGKDVALEMSGEDTEIDRKIAEELSDPLLHMIRNALDHGIETPAQRIQAGKNPLAILRVAAYHQGGQIVVEIADDGRGLNRERILTKALENGLIQPGHQLSDDEVNHLIFEPGFSTAETITDISGRGVGMDVVKKQVQKLRGRIEIKSTPGKGTNFYLKLPLTLAIIDALIVAVGPNRYLLPVASVRQIFRPKPEMLSSIHGRSEMVLVKDRLLPLVRLHNRFQIEPRTEDPCEGLLVEAECEGHVFCLMVDEMLGRQEVVMKSLGEVFKGIPGISNCAILGDGRVGLILELAGIFSSLGVAGGSAAGLPAPPAYLLGEAAQRSQVARSASIGM